MIGMPGQKASGTSKWPMYRRSDNIEPFDKPKGDVGVRAVQVSCCGNRPFMVAVKNGVARCPYCQKEFDLASN